MNDKALYLQKIEAELNEWKAQIDLFKAKSLSATADVKISMNENIKMLEAKVEELEKEKGNVRTDENATCANVG